MTSKEKEKKAKEFYKKYKNEDGFIDLSFLRNEDYEKGIILNEHTSLMLVGCKTYLISDDEIKIKSKDLKQLKEKLSELEDVKEALRKVRVLWCLTMLYEHKEDDTNSHIAYLHINNILHDKYIFKTLPLEKAKIVSEYIKEQIEIYPELNKFVEEYIDEDTFKNFDEEKK